MSEPSAATLSPKEITALVVLLAEARELTNPELSQLAGINVSGETRRALVSKGLVTERRVGRANAFTLSTQGWTTGVEVLASQATLSGASGGALSALVRALGRALKHHTLKPRQFFTLAEPTPQPLAPVPQPSIPDKRPPLRDTQPAARDPQTQVRAAYARLASTPAAWVTLADLRETLTGLNRQDVDAALRGLARCNGVRLIPVANLKSLTQRDRDAALRLGGEDNHVLSIEAA